MGSPKARSLLILTLIFLFVLSLVDSNLGVPQITDRPRIVVYETYYFYHYGIPESNPFALSEDDLRNRKFGFIEEEKVFYYLSCERDVEILIEYFPILNKIRICSRRLYDDENEITEGEILENFDGYVANLRDSAIQDFVTMLFKGNLNSWEMGYRTPLKFLSIKGIQFRELEKNEFGKSDAVEIKNETGQLIAWTDASDSSNYLSWTSRTIYLVSNYPETGTEGRLEPNNSIMKPYEDSLESAFEMGDENATVEYSRAIGRYYLLSKEYYNTLDDFVSTSTIIPLLFLRRNVTAEMLEAHRILGEINEPFDSLRDYWKAKIAIEIDKLDFGGDIERFKILLMMFIDDLYDRKKENYEYLNGFLPPIKEEIETMEIIEGSINGVIFSNGGFLVFLTITISILKFFYKKQFKGVIDWVGNKSELKLLLLLIILWILIHDSLKIVYFQYGITNQRLDWIGTMSEFQSCCISIILVFSAFFLYSVKKDCRNTSGKTLATMSIAIPLSVLYLIRSNSNLYFLILSALVMLFLVNIDFKDKKAKLRKEGKLFKRNLQNLWRRQRKTKFGRYFMSFFHNISCLIHK